MIKKLNSANPGVKRPLRVSDLQDIWDGLNSALGSFAPSTSPRIVSGFNLKADETFSAGVIAYNGELYFYPDNASYTISAGDTVYLIDLANVDLRVFGDDSTQDFAFNRFAQSDDTTGINIGAFTLERVAALRLQMNHRLVSGRLRFNGDGTVKSWLPQNPIDANINVTVTTTYALPFSLWVTGLIFKDGNNLYPEPGATVILTDTNWLVRNIQPRFIIQADAISLFWNGTDVTNTDDTIYEVGVTMFFKNTLDV